MNKGKFHGFRKKKLEAKVGRKPAFPWFFLPLVFPLSPRRVSRRHHLAPS